MLTVNAGGTFNVARLAAERQGVCFFYSPVHYLHSLSLFIPSNLILLPRLTYPLLSILSGVKTVFLYVNVPLQLRQNAQTPCRREWHPRCDHQYR